MVTPPTGCLSYALPAGDDTRAILKALGRDDREIDRLILEGVVSEPALAEG